MITTLLRSATPYESGLAALAIVATLVAAVTIIAPAEPAAPRPGGAVLGEVERRATAAPVASPEPVTSPVPRPSASRPEQSPGNRSPASSPSGPASSPRGDLGPELPELAVGRATIRTWKDSFERSRLQIIVPIRNDDDRWLRFPDASSTYEIVASKGELMGGRLFALPALLGPGETAYLVDTVSIPGLKVSDDLVARPHVVAMPADPVGSALTSSDVRLTTGVGGGLLASGRVRNESDATTRRVIAGVVALRRDGTPVAAVYDSFDLGRLDAGEERAFLTESEPGGPPIDDVSVSELVAIAFEVAQ